MARHSDSSGVVYLKAVRSKLRAKRAGSAAAKKTTSAPVIAHALPAPGLRAFIREIYACKLLVKSAQHQIEILVERNAALQQELIELARQEAKARYLAYHDGLTGLPNRSLLQDRFQQALSQAERRHKPLALLMLDLDEFKLVNDRLGHASGDKVLQAVALRLTRGIRGADTACRYGGDEFVIMLPEIDSPDTATALVAEIGKRLSEPYIISGHKIFMAASIGVAVYPGDGRTLDDLMKQADIAMYRAKRTGDSTHIIEQRKESAGQGALYKPADPGNAERTRERDFFIESELMRAQGQHKKHQQI